MNQFNYKDIFNNNHVAISRAISLIENSDAIVDNFYKAIYEKSNFSIRIGITDPLLPITFPYLITLNLQLLLPLNTFADIDHSKLKLGYDPQINISEGIPILVKWYRDYYNV